MNLQQRLYAQRAGLLNEAPTHRGKKEVATIKKRAGKLMKDPSISKWAQAWAIWELKIKTGPTPQIPKNLSPAKADRLKKKIVKIIQSVLSDPLD